MAVFFCYIYIYSGLGVDRPQKIVITISCFEAHTEECLAMKFNLVVDNFHCWICSSGWCHNLL
jgi:hypothetical protein